MPTGITSSDTTEGAVEDVPSDDDDNVTLAQHLEVQVKHRVAASGAGSSKRPASSLTDAIPPPKQRRTVAKRVVRKILVPQDQLVEVSS